MSKKEVVVHLETITPLWTGDAWQKSCSIRPSSLMGSLRFWFEIICYFAGIVKKSDFDAKYGKIERQIDYEKLKKTLLNCGSNLEEAVDAIGRLGVPLPAIVFGTTGWKSLIEIKEIKLIGDYCFGNRLSLPIKICVSKNSEEIEENANCPNRSSNEWSVFYFPHPPYFFGEFQVKFLVENFILNDVFYPLLTFMDEYGYWGGRWNIGYGRLKVKQLQQDDWRKCEFKFERFNKGNKRIEDLVIETILTDTSLDSSFDKLIELDNNKKINIIIEEKLRSADLKEVIKELIYIRAKARARHHENFPNINATEERHKIFGTIKGPPYNKDHLPQGSKILPYIKRENGNYVGGFLSIVDVLNLYNKGGQND
jgi:CRISPR-associated protein Cmr1